MSGHELSQPMRAALDLFLHHLRGEGLPDFPAGPGDDALSPDYQKAVGLLRACDPQNAVPTEAAPKPELIQSRFDDSMKEVRTVSLTELAIVASNGLPSCDPPPIPDTPPIADQPAVSPPDLSKEEMLSAAAPAPSLLAIRQVVTLKNARAGEEYSDILVLEGGRDIVLAEAGGTGLSFDPTDFSFTGIPVEAGDFELKLAGKINDRPAEITAKLAVIPDPKSLWTSDPSDQSAPFWKPDEAFQHLDGAGLRMFAASKRGRSHAKGGGFREDDFALATHGPWHIAAVADGAGSARYSRRGSRLAVETIERELPPLIDQHLGDDFEAILKTDDQSPEIARRLYETLVTSAFSAADALVKQAEALEVSPASLSTTLIVVIARRYADRWFIAAFSIGDGGAALLDLEGGQVIPLTLPDAGEYAGQTRFLAKSEFASAEDVAKRLRYVTPKHFTALALMSDGITDPKLPTDTIFADGAAWTAFWSDDLAKGVDFSAPVEVVGEAFLAWLDFWSPGNHDDRTLAVLLPQDG